MHNKLQQWMISSLQPAQSGLVNQTARLGLPNPNLPRSIHTARLGLTNPNPRRSIGIDKSRFRQSHQSVWRLLILIFALIGLGLPSAFGRLPKELTFAPLKFDPPKPQKRTLSNGIQLYLLEDHELPLFDVRALLKTGGIYDPPEKVGLASIFADVMRTGGTISREPDALNEELESMAASVEIGMGQEYGTASLSSLADDIETGLEIFADVLRNPAFREDKLELRKQQEIEQIRRRNDNPIQLAWRYFSATLYGTDHPFGWYPEIEGVESITVEDLKAFHVKYYHPNNIMLSITGDFETEKLIAELEKLFGNWNRATVSFPAVPSVEGTVKPSVVYISKDLTQSTIWMGHFGIKRSPNLSDYFAVRVMNEILGESGFTSRLMREVREKRGLAYQVGSYLDRTVYTNPGEWFAYSRTRADKTAEAMSLILEIVTDMRTNPVPASELQLTKDSLINSFVFGFESSGQIAFQQMLLDFRGYAPDFLETFTNNIAKVTAQDVLNAAKKYLHPDAMVMVVVGNQDTFDRPLAEFGEVTEISLSGPTPPPEPIPEASTADVEKAKKLIVQVINAHGGIDKLKSVKNIVSKGRLVLNMGGGTMEAQIHQTLVLPNMLRQELTIPMMGRMIQIYDGQSGWMESPQGTQPFPESVAEAMRTGILRETSHLLASLQDEAVSVQYLGVEDVNGTAADVILVSESPVGTIKLFFAQDTKHLIRQDYRALTQMGQVNREEYFDDYREVSGVKVAFRVVQLDDGQKGAEVTLNDVQINAAVDDTLFEK